MALVAPVKRVVSIGAVAIAVPISIVGAVDSYSRWAQRHDVSLKVLA